MKEKTTKEKEEAIDDFLYKKAKIFHEENAPVHIETHSKKYYNGYILRVHADFIILEDIVVGENPIFFVEIKSIDKYKER